MHFVMIHKHDCSRFVVLISCWAEMQRVVTVLLLFSEERVVWSFVFHFLFSQLLGETTWILTSVDIVLYKYRIFNE